MSAQTTLLNNSDSLSGVMNELKTLVGNGGVIAFPTDTFYGLGVDPRQERAIERVFQVKQRPADKPLLVLISSLKQAEGLVKEIPSSAMKLIDRFWPGPLTLILPARDDLPRNLTAGTGKLGVRIPGNALTRQLLDGIACPLTAPSANTSGFPPPRSASEVEEQLGQQIDWILDGGLTPGDKESSIVDLTRDLPTLLRAGAVPTDDLESTLGHSLTMISAQ
ncbi:MAG: threonylcarbamoyl-AMP synthase [Candidatus Nitrohelix vancouverensis]|uniref:L-threonylcarbamoyladenylate synthase n=1 Tax=Candidatus Nitrohelix vancouverensis TaxID=2705534 RepID=A0A7T0C2P5_9BACT|nr:MAG: threonylcarbamoyl-AMP synthase [Candidatus Nitrohelix vancouverensis]